MRSIAFVSMMVLVAGSTPGAFAQTCDRPCVGPRRGAIIAAGGGSLDQQIYGTFVEMAGGAEARVVLIPTAGAEYGSHDGWTAIEKLRRAGVEQLEILHTRNADVANLEAFASPLEDATAVWFSGGRQWRLVDVYLDTETHRELHSLLAQGGASVETPPGRRRLPPSFLEVVNETVRSSRQTVPKASAFFTTWLWISIY